MKLLTFMALICVFCTIAISVNGQVTHQGQQKDPDIVATDPPRDSVITYGSMTSEEFRAWDFIDSVWMASVYWPTLKKRKLKMDCSHCGSIMLQVEMQIDSAGKMLQYRVVKENKCGEPFPEMLKNDFMDYFITLEFPAPLRGIVLKVHLGTGLKC